jgi:hypothetical protein
MSGALGTVARVAGVAGSVNSILGLVQTNVYLGDVTFFGIQVPEQIAWGGSQRTVRHVMPGGGVVMSLLGIDYPQLTWSGIFEGASAGTFSRRLYLMMVGGDLQQLSWLDKSYTVVVSRFEASDERENWVRYQITLDILYDNLFGPPAGRGGRVRGLLGSVLADLKSALALADVAQDVIGRMQAAAGLVSALTKNSPDTLALQSDNAEAIAALKAERATQDAAIDRLALQAPAGALLPPGSPQVAAANVLAAVDAARGSARASGALGYLGRTGTNLGNAPT